MSEIISEIRNEVNYQLDNFDFNQINKLAQLIKKTDKNIYFMGIGKSGNIAKHCSDLLKSISISCHYIDPINLLHGDIGVVKNNIVIMFSKSGNTKEIIDIIPFFKERNCYLVGVCCDINSKFETYCDLLIKTPFIKELDGEINKIPTNSFMSHLLFSNILVSLLKDTIDINKYKMNHPAGNIGKNLMKIVDCLIYEFPKITFDKEVLLHNVLLEMTTYKIGCCFFVNNYNNLLGILTDGDIRRLLLNNENKKDINIDDINKKYYYETDLDKFIMDCKKINYIPILEKNKLSGIIKNN